MSSLIIVRHGQASFHGDNYDQLSPLGARQGFELGSYWVRMGITPDRVFMGPRARHKQTLDACARAFSEAGLPFPEPEMLPHFDEHEGTEVVKEMLNAKTGGNNLVPEGTQGKDAVRAYFTHFQRITRSWIKGELDHLGYETWRAFRDRVQAGLEKATDVGGGKTVAVFTSGGPVAAAVGHVLELRDEQILELSWSIRNGSLSEYLFNKGKLSAISMNSVPHLQKKDLISLV